MTQHMTDRTVLSHIERLVAEEKRLYAKGVVSDSERARLNQIDIELDRCWDLLRQRRAHGELARPRPSTPPRERPDRRLPGGPEGSCTRSARNGADRWRYKLMGRAATLRLPRRNPSQVQTW